MAASSTRTMESIAPGLQDPAEDKRVLVRKRIGLVAGVVFAFVVYFAMPNDLEQPARLTAGVAALMAAWWMTEAIPLAATALVPLVLFPALNVAPIDEVAPPYANDIIFLFMGGFLLALSLQRWNLHRRIALATVLLVGTKPRALIGGFMIATGFLSMWVSNTATAVMMLPIGISVLALVAGMGGEADAANGAQPDATGAKRDAKSGAEDGAEQSAEQGGPQRAKLAAEDGAEQSSTDDIAKKAPKNFSIALMLGIAYAASIGSLGTIIGTPPNALMVGYLSEAHDIDVGFGEWMLVGVPMSIVFMFIAWFLLTRIIFKPEIKEIPGGRKLIRDQYKHLGPMNNGEKQVLVLFILAAAAWISVPLLWPDSTIADAVIAMAVAVLLFILPADFKKGVPLLNWSSAKALPWDILILFGGGLALSAQFGASGLSEWVGTQVAALEALPLVLLVLIVAAIVLMLTELTSNTATAATFLPLIGGVAVGLGLDPMLLVVPVAIAATCAFMLPVATPPNAIAFSSGYIEIVHMMKAGVWLNAIALVLTTITTLTLAAWVFGLAY